MPQEAEKKLPTTSLIELLKAKGILTEQEATSLTQNSPCDEPENRIAQLLLSKGLITQKELEEATASSASSPASSEDPKPNENLSSPEKPLAVATVALHPCNGSKGQELPGGPSPTASSADPPPADVPPTRIRPIAPIRPLPLIDHPQSEGLIPSLKLPSGANFSLYGFLKASAVEDTASSGGPIFGAGDFPLPLLLGDTGPNGDPQFYVKARSSRLGANFGWPDVARNVTLTGRLEFDFEGDFTSVNNRNISSARSSQPSLRLAWARVDTKIGKVPWFLQFGQDWTILGSSTLPDYFETTGLGVGMGSFYERAPMVRTGFQLGGENFKVQPEFAVVLPVFGEASLTDQQRAREGTLAGPESNHPDLQARLVFQFPLVHTSGVAPAQIIFSGGHALETEVVARADLPTTPVAALGGRSIQSFFPQGFRENSHRNAWTVGAQLPTSWATLVAKYYRGSDLRFFFAGQLNEAFFDTQGMTPLATVPSLANRQIPILNVGGTPVPAAMRPIRGQGGFLQLGLPLSRIFGANPSNRVTAGWSIYLGYGVDTAYARDTVRFGGNGLRKTDLGIVTLRYQLNKYVTFVDEVSYWDTRAAIEKVFRGLPAFTAHSWRNEVGPTFVF